MSNCNSGTVVGQLDSSEAQLTVKGRSMAGPGTAPEGPAKRRRRNASEAETVLVPDDERRGPTVHPWDLRGQLVDRDDGARRHGNAPSFLGNLASLMGRLS